MNDTVFLRKAEHADAHELVKWRNENREWFPPGPLLTLEDHIAWFEQEYELNPADNMYMIGVLGVGYIGTVSLIVSYGRGEISRVILGEKQHARKGYMQVAIQMLMAAYGLEFYWLRVKAENYPAIKLYEKLGFMYRGKTNDRYVKMEHHWTPYGVWGPIG